MFEVCGKETATKRERRLVVVGEWGIERVAGLVSLDNNRVWEGCGGARRSGRRMKREIHQLKSDGQIAGYKNSCP